MKAKVLKSFVDKSSGGLRVSGSEVECSDERFKELSEKGYLEKATEKVEKKDTETDAKNTVKADAKKAGDGA
jgi:hypothetical protein